MHRFIQDFQLAKNHSRLRFQRGLRETRTTTSSFSLSPTCFSSSSTTRTPRSDHQQQQRYICDSTAKLSAPGRSYHTTMSNRSPTPPQTTASATAWVQGGEANPQRVPVTFPVSSVPPNPLGEGKYIRTAAALIIGDEILNGKTLDSNSYVFAQFCFEHGIELKRIEVIPDNENEIIEASRRLVKQFDLVVTSGGIGPTHDDITYASLAKAFDTPLVHHEETIRRMRIMNEHRKWVKIQNEQQLAATHRMALFPENSEVIFVDESIWVPVVRLAGRLCIFPGVPALFQKMLHSLTSFLPLPPKHERQLRIQIFTERAESMIAPYLTELQERLRPHGIQVGSYPVLYKGVFVSLIGRDLDTPPSSRPSSPSAVGHSPSPSKRKRHSQRIWLADVAREVEKEVGGRVLSEEEVAEQKKESRILAVSPGWGDSKGRKETGQMEDELAKAENSSAVKAKF